MMFVGFVFLTATCTLALEDNQMELLLVQAIWRHGDRSPTGTFPTDPFQEGNWTFGGGGFGQLSPTGMKQHFDLGKQLRQRYVDTGYLGKRYSSKEIYVRSTDRNRTLISAMANMMGMYGQNDGSNVKNVDFPEMPGWPLGYVPIPVHTIDRSTDYIGVAHIDCYRREKLWNMAKNMDEVKEYLDKPSVVNLFKHLTDKCGYNVDTENIWIVRDALLIEQIYDNETLREENKWFSDELFQEITDVDIQITLYGNGIFNKPIIKNNIDIGLEIQKSRGGSMFNDLNDRMYAKVDCLNNLHRPQCSWIKHLKYYVYSAHDSTISAFLAILGIHTKVIPSGYPGYTTAVFIELWINKKDKQPYFKLLYHPSDENSTIYPITNEIDACQGKIYCSLDVFREFAARTKPDQPMEKWCQVDPWRSDAASTWFSRIALILISCALFLG